MTARILPAVLLMSFSLQLSAAGTGQSATAQAAAQPLFTASDECLVCHNGLITPQGEDVSIGSDWRPSMMANSARDPYWQAAVRREVMDHPQAQAAIEHECAACHMPMPRFEGALAGLQQSVFLSAPHPLRQTRADQLAADGVSCTVCHQIQNQGFGEKRSFNAGFQVDTALPLDQRRVFGPHAVDGGRATLMRSASGFLPAENPAVTESEMCATCHTLFTHTLGPDGKVLREFPEQVPYLEWRHSRYRDSHSCQACHMPPIAEEMPISSVLGVPRPGLSPHRFRGGNFFMPRMFTRYADELGVTASAPELELMARRTEEHLAGESARLRLTDVRGSASGLEAVVEVENLAGHKLPTAYPSRRVWLQFRLSDRDGTPIFESGAFQPDGSIRGNDNDLDAAAFEPHWSLITEPGQVQIYETVMVDHQGRVTTGLLSAYEYVKDNRLLPEGFDPATAPEDVAVRGKARDDGDFRDGGDRLTYRVAVPGTAFPVLVEVELWYQPIGFRWAKNLVGLGTMETDRFSGYFEALAGSSAVRLARAEQQVALDR